MPNLTSLQILQRGYGDYEAGEESAVMDIIHPDLLIESQGAIFSEHETIRGPAEYQEKRIKRIEDAFEVFELLDKADYARGEDLVLLTVTLRTVEKGTKKERIRKVGWEWTMKDGKCWRCKDWVGPTLKQD